jgi:hypothetical protein
MSGYIKRPKQSRLAPVVVVDPPAKKADVRRICRARDRAERAQREAAARVEADAAWIRDAPAREEAERKAEEAARKAEEAARKAEEETRRAVWERLERGWRVCTIPDWERYALEWAEKQGYKFWTPECPCNCCNMACNSATCRGGCYGGYDSD